MALSDSALLASQGSFLARLQEQIATSAIAIINEVANDVQTITVTGTPTGGTISLGTLPGSVVINQTGTLATTTAVTALTSTVGMFVGMAVAGPNIPAGTTIAAITSATALTLSAAATGSGSFALVFSGTPIAIIPFNAVAGDVQAIIAALAQIGNNDVFCSGGPFPGTPIAVTWAGVLGNMPQRLMTITANALTGGASPNASVAHTTMGVNANLHVQRAQFAGNAIKNLSWAASMMAPAVCTDATILTDFGAGGVNGQAAVTDAHIANAVSTVWNAFV
jgi:hypothetical protein